MVGRVPQVSFLKEKLSVFGRNDSPLARGRLQNAKIKELRSKRIIFGTTETFAEERRNGEMYFYTAKSGLRDEFRAFLPFYPRRLGPRPRQLYAVCRKDVLHDGGGRSFPQYGKLFRDFSMLWKNIFHTVEKTARFFHTLWKTRF